MKTQRKILFAAAAAGLLLGLGACVSTPATRIADHPGVFDRLTPDEQALVRQGRVGIGMDPGTVKLALGDPDRVTLETTAKGAFEVWHYQQVVYYDGDFLYPGPYWYHRRPYWGSYWGEGPWGFDAPAAVYDHFRIVFTNGKVVQIHQEMPST
jgi:hypothetical protein